MKTFFFIISILTGNFFNQAFAANNDRNPGADDFRVRFEKATEVQWVSAGELQKVRFTLDGQVSTAYYDAEGHLVALTRQIKANELPAALQSSLRTEMGGRWISDLFVVETGTASHYYVTLENADQKMVLQALNGRKWTRFQQAEKI